MPHPYPEVRSRFRPVLDQRPEGLRSDVPREYWKHERMFLEIPPPPPPTARLLCDGGKQVL